jgi:hypothetical protein
MPVTIRADQLAATVSDMLKDYAGDCSEVLEETVKKVTKDAANELKSAGTFGGTGKYRKGWKAKVEKSRLGVEGVVYNAAMPGLTHLLEHGHALRGGGRSRSFPHIAPVNEKAQQAAVDELERKL